MQRSVEILEPSVRSLFLSIRVNGQQISTGTGFIVNSPAGFMLLTNRHIVTGRDNNTDEPLSSNAAIPDEITISHNLEGALGSWIERSEPLYDNGNRLWHEHPTLGSQADIVALPITQIENVEFRAYDINQQTILHNPRPSDIISVVGFPFGIGINGRLAIWATGFVASETDLISPIFLIDSRTRRGQSGSPVIAHRNPGAHLGRDNNTHITTQVITQFLGIYSGRINAESDIGIVWKASAIQELIMGITNP